MTFTKYKAVRTGKYASKKEAKVASDLAALASDGKIQNLREQVKFLLIPGKNGVSGISYIADFTFVENDALHVVDVKPFDKKTNKFRKTPEFRLKERMMYLLLGITIELM